MYRQTNVKSFCLLVALAACFLLAQARPNRRYQLEPSGYGQRGDEYYRGREPHHSHDAPRDGPYHEEYKEYKYRYCCFGCLLLLALFGVLHPVNSSGVLKACNVSLDRFEGDRAATAAAATTVTALAVAPQWVA